MKETMKEEERGPVQPEPSLESYISTDTESALNFLESFCGIIVALGESGGLENAAGTDISIFAKEAQDRVCYLRDKNKGFKK